MSKKKKPPTPVKGITTLSENLNAIVEAAEEAVALPKEKAKTEREWLSANLNDGSFKSVPKKAGVYCFVLPEQSLPKKRQILLHGRTFGKPGERRQLQFRFNYQATPLNGETGVVVYVGKASNLHGRLKGHLSVNVKATTNQVLRGLAGKLSMDLKKSDLKSAGEKLRAGGQFFFFEHHHDDEDRNPRKTLDVGQSYVADRDLLEIKLIAKFEPPFNIKAER